MKKFLAVLFVFLSWVVNGQQIINYTDPLRTGTDKINANFVDIYSKVMPVVTNEAQLAATLLTFTNVYLSGFFNNGVFTAYNIPIALLVTNGFTVIQSTVNTNYFWFKDIYADFISPAWFGAKPNDGFDDTDAIRATLRASAQGLRSVIIPSGEYNIAFSVTNASWGHLFDLPPGLKLVGSHGSRLVLNTTNLQVNNAVFAVMTNSAYMPATNITIDGITLVSQVKNVDAIRLNQPDALTNSPTLNMASNVTISGVSFSGFRNAIIVGNNVRDNQSERYAKNISIQNCVFSDCVVSIYAEGTGIDISGCYFNGGILAANNTNAILVYAGRNVNIYGNIFEKYVASDYPIRIGNNGTRHIGAENVNIANNTFNNCSYYAIGIEPRESETNGVQNVSVSGNIIKASYGIVVNNNTGTGPIKDVLIANNIMRLTGSGILIDGRNGSKIDGLCVANNTVMGGGAGEVFRLTEASSANVNGNLFHYYFPTANLLCYVSNVNYPNITGNTWQDTVDTTAAESVLMTGCNYGQIMGNKFYVLTTNKTLIFTNLQSSHFLMNGAVAGTNEYLIIPTNSTLFGMPVELGGTGTNALSGIVHAAGGQAFFNVAGVSNYVPVWSTNQTELTLTSDIWNDLNQHVGIGWTVPSLTNQTAMLSVARGLAVGTNADPGLGAGWFTGSLLSGGEIVGTNLYAIRSQFIPTLTNWYRVISTNVISSGLVRIDAQDADFWLRGDMLVSYYIPAYSGVPVINILSGSSAITNCVRGLRASTDGSGSGVYLDLWIDPNGSTNWLVTMEFQGKNLGGILDPPTFPAGPGVFVSVTNMVYDLDGFKTSGTLYGAKLNIGFWSNAVPTAVIAGNTTIGGTTTYGTNNVKLVIDGGTTNARSVGLEMVGFMPTPSNTYALLSTWLGASNLASIGFSNGSDTNSSIMTFYTKQNSGSLSNQWMINTNGDFVAPETRKIESLADLKIEAAGPIWAQTNSTNTIRIGGLVAIGSITNDPIYQVEVYGNGIIKAITALKITNSLRTTQLETNRFRVTRNNNDHFWITEGFAETNFYMGFGYDTNGIPLTFVPDKVAFSKSIYIGPQASHTNPVSDYAIQSDGFAQFSMDPLDYSTNFTQIGGYKLLFKLSPTDITNSSLIDQGSYYNAMTIVGKGIVTTNRLVAIADNLILPTGGISVGDTTNWIYGGINATNNIQSSQLIIGNELYGISTPSTSLPDGIRTNYLRAGGNAVLFKQEVTDQTNSGYIVNNTYYNSLTIAGKGPGTTNRQVALVDNVTVPAGGISIGIDTNFIFGGLFATNNIQTMTLAIGAELWGSQTPSTGVSDDIRTNYTRVGGTAITFKQEGADNTNSGFIVNGAYDGALNLVGKGSTTTNRLVTAYDNFSVPYGGITAGSVTNFIYGGVYATSNMYSEAYMVSQEYFGINTPSMAALDDIRTNYLRAGGTAIAFKQYAGDEANSGFIVNGAYDSALNIVGKGNALTNRLVTLYDNLAVTAGGITAGTATNFIYGGMYATSNMESQAYVVSKQYMGTESPSGSDAAATRTNYLRAGGSTVAFRQASGDYADSGLIANGVSYGSLSLVGKGDASTNRLVSVIDNLTVPAGGITAGNTATFIPGGIYATNNIQSDAIVVGNQLYGITTPSSGDSAAIRQTYLRAGGTAIAFKQDGGDDAASGFVSNGAYDSALNVVGKGASPDRFVTLYDNVAIPSGGLYVGAALTTSDGAISTTDFIRAGGGYKSSDGTFGITTNINFVSTNMAGGFVTNDVTIKDGLITGWTQ